MSLPSLVCLCLLLVSERARPFDPFSSYQFLVTFPFPPYLFFVLSRKVFAFLRSSLWMPLCILFGLLSCRQMVLAGVTHKRWYFL